MSKKSCDFCGFNFDIESRCQCDRNVDRQNTQYDDVTNRLKSLSIKDAIVNQVVKHYQSVGFIRTYSREIMLIHIIENLITARNELIKQIEDEHKFCAGGSIIAPRY